jgi:hypothetical protein
MGSVVGSSTVTISGNTEIGAEGSGGGYVFAAARGDEALDDAHQAYVGSSSLTISGGTIWVDAYGGGQNGIVKGAVSVSMSNGTVKGDVYGGGQLAKTNTYITESKEYVLVTGLTVGTSSVKGYYTESGGVYTAVPGDDPKAADGTDYYQKVETTVSMSGGTITGDLYGGGLGRQAAAGPPAVSAVAADVNGPVTVTVSGGKAANVFGCNNLYGAPQRTVDEDAEEAFVRDYCPEQSPLGEAFGCGDDGIAVFGDDEICARRRAVFGFDDEDEQGKELAEIATRILLAYGFEDESAEDDDDVGMIVNVGTSDAQDYGIMVDEILSASSIEELQEIVDVYAESMPTCARELAEICVKEYPNGGTLRFAC